MIACPAQAGEPTYLKIIFIRVCVFDTCGFHQCLFLILMVGCLTGSFLKLTIQLSGYRHRAQGAEHRAQGTGRRAQGAGHRAQSAGHRAHTVAYCSLCCKLPGLLCISLPICSIFLVSALLRILLVLHLFPKQWGLNPDNDSDVLIVVFFVNVIYSFVVL